MNEPWVTSHAYDIAVIGLMLGTFGAVALCYAAERLIKAARKLRSAELGDELLAACGGDNETAEKAIENVKIENAALIEAAGRVFNPEYRRRQAEFTAACQDAADGGRRWQQVH